MLFLIEKFFFVFFLQKIFVNFFLLSFWQISINSNPEFSFRIIFLLFKFILSFEFQFLPSHSLQNSLKIIYFFFFVNSLSQTLFSLSHLFLRMCFLEKIFNHSSFRNLNFSQIKTFPITRPLTPLLFFKNLFTNLKSPVHSHLFWRSQFFPCIFDLYSLKFIFSFWEIL